MTISIYKSIIPLLISCTLGVGCGDSKDSICGGHGEMQDTQCECDPGFVPSADGSSCESAPDSENFGGDFFFEPSEVEAVTGTSNNSQIWILDAMENDVQLRIEIYEAYGGISSPGTITIDDVETDYANCGTCLLLKTGCVEHGDHFDCSRTFMPTVGGEIRIEQIGTNAGDEFSGRLLGVVFQEVTISQDYQTVPVANGETIELAPWAFETLLDDLN